MNIKSFRAKSMHEALELVRKELGPDAALLHSREVPQRGLKGLLGGKEIELAASKDANLKSRFDIEVPPEEEEPEPTDEAVVEQHEQPSESDEAPRPIDLGIDLEAMSFNQTFFGNGPAYPPALLRIRERLIDAEVPGILADGLCERVLNAHPEESQQQEDMLVAAIRQEIMKSIPIGRDIDDTLLYPRVVAAIGPTGVGKTTTIAKLAARAKFDYKRRVGLVTVDTYRIAAVDQLQTYAEIMDLPMKIVATPMEVRNAINELSDCQQIFVDTAGRSPRDEVQVQQLRSLIKAASPDETYLVLSAPSSSRSLAEAVEKFAGVAPTSWVLTKIDEVGSLGNTLSFLQDPQLPLAYVTNGQDVPQAIAAADAEDLVSRIL
ncbi:flagellar biosynthesis protein FlhF [Bremerella cremea]|uniref:Flagellar biosynthesis protein FlhF n=1 Tax=Blastopirellula marina TaxID=124 RepID=A0A2S8FR17_9BACT|nr:MULTISPECIES: flagellar biosynthesis protein FlhF [Pirellulaceae]PQO34597.1 flagellar biosynthesis protein FlhF [Blastopirellula marina]RCS47094.1 flagellar biosynthesis protein FlhF [Bremerella cremea]